MRDNRVREDQYCLRAWTQSDSLLQLEIGNSNINENWNQYFIIDINIEFQYEDSLAKILQNHFSQTQSDHAHNLQNMSLCHWFLRASSQV